VKKKHIENDKTFCHYDKSFVTKRRKNLSQNESLYINIYYK